MVPHSLSHIYINHPEPPQQTGSKDGSQAEHLLTEEFLNIISNALIDGGLLCICTDNAWYAELLCRNIGALKQYRSLTPRFAGLEVNAELDGWNKYGINIFSGVPGKHCGVPDAEGASSYFDRMFQSGLSNHASAFERYTICVRVKRTSL
jgi:hypothetical protein|tara:strand:+ start:417 stop:866 length:450 start_codon:yes stop_codon:yes gene_type:complete